MPPVTVPRFLHPWAAVTLTYLHQRTAHSYVCPPRWEHLDLLIAPFISLHAYMMKGMIGFLARTQPSYPNQPLG